MRFRYSLLSLLAVLLAVAPSAQADLILTGVADGDLPGGVPKAVELYVVNDIADLSVYAVGSANNGGGTDGPEISLSGSATAGDFLYIASETPNFTTFFGFAPDFDASATGNAFAVSVNGDDALELFYDAAGFPADLSAYAGTASVVDTFGEITHGGGSLPWAYTDGWAYRMDATGPEGATFTLGNWTYALNGLDNALTNATAPMSFPIGSYQNIVVPPADPTVSFVGSEATRNEGGSLVLQVQIDFSGQAAPIAPVTVTFTVDGGSANAADFTGPVPASVTFTGTTDGEIQTATVDIASGDGDEPQETATFGLSVTAGNAVVGDPAEYTLTIRDTDAPEIVSLADARAAGVGAFVSFVGTVTRAQNDFTYLQDETGGLAIRQTSGAFSDDVESGAIAPGTRIRVTGTLSEFRNLLQINGGDLDSYAIAGTRAIPTPQIVTLAQIAADGEAYESELVYVENATIDGAGATEFAAGSNYGITDASDATNAVSLRVPNADDTEVDGTSVPTTTANITGIVSQFDTDPATGSTEGYQILVIGAGDVQAVTAGEDDIDRPEPMLTVANPLQGEAMIRFATGVAGRASLALYDALGRQVVSLVDGAVDGGTQAVALDAGALASGVYVLRLQAEGSVISRTLTVVR